MTGLDPTIKAQIQVVLQKCPPLESDSTLKAIFIDARLHPWQARLPQATNTADRVDGAMAFLWQQYHAAFMANGLVLFLQVLADQFDDNDKLHIDLHALATQLAVTIEPPRIINLPTSPTSALADCPYRSLFAFRPEHAPIFFGRESFTQQLVTTMQRQPFTALLGASGSGKSSVVMAGLVPALNGTQDKWLFSQFRPTDNPFLGLANALVPLLEPAMSSIKQLSEAADLAAHLRQGKFPLRNVLQRIQEMRPDHRLLLIADQFEELYTTAKAEREPFMDLLIAAVQNPMPNFKLVTTMRADFLEQASRYRPFADTLQHQTILVGPMTREEMSLAIEQPALMQGVSFEPHLLGRILDDVGKAEGNLPLLEFALSELWPLQAEASLTLAAYEQIGQVKGALSRHADKVFAERLSAAEQGQARRIFVNLVTPGQGAEDTRRVAPQADLAENWPLVTKLATERLVVTNEHEKIQTAEVVHEALIRHWGRLREWLAADREFLVWRQRLRDDLKQWLDTNRDDGALLRGAPLATAQDWLSQRAAELNEAEKAFIEVSQKEQARRQRQQRLGVGALISFLLVVIAVMFSLNLQRQTALNQANTRLLLAQSKEVFEEKPLLAIRLALESEAIAPSDMKDEVRTTLSSLMSVGRIAKLGQNVTQILTTTITDTILINHANQPSILLNLNTGQVITLSGKVYEVYYSPESNGDFVIDYEYALSELRLQQGQQVITLSENISDHEKGVYYSPDNNGDFVVVYDYYENIPELRLQHGQQVITLNGKIEEIYYSPESNGDFVIDYEYALSELRLQHGQQVITLSGRVDRIHYSPENNGDFVVVYENKDTLPELRLKHDQQVITLSENINKIEYSPENNGDFIVVYPNMPGELWLQHGQQVITLSENIDKIEYSPENNGDFVVIYHDSPTELWLQHGQRVITLNDKVYGVSYSPENNGDFVVIYHDSPIELWLQHGQRVITLSNEVYGVSYSSENNGDFVVVYHDSPTELWLQHGQRVITLSNTIDEIDEIKYSPENNGDFMVIYRTSPIELWLQHGQQVITLNGLVNGVINNSMVYYSPENNGDFIIQYSNGLAELRLDHGHKIITLSGTILLNGVSYIPQNNGDFAVVYENSSPELWLQHGQQVISLNSKMIHIGFASQGTYFKIDDDEDDELWHGQERRQLTHLGLGLNGSIFDEPNDRLFVWYSDGRAYLLDLAMLSAIHPESSLEELKRVGCERLRRDAPWFNEAEVEPYLFGAEARGCR